MKRFKVENSTRIAEMGYDYDNLTLEVLFAKGGTYQYWPISPSGYEAFMKSESKGQFFEKHIKSDKSINYRKVDDLQSS